MNAAKIESLLKNGAKKQELFENIRRLMLNQLQSQKIMIKLVESLVMEEMKHDLGHKPSVYDWEDKFVDYFPWKFQYTTKRKWSSSMKRKIQLQKYNAVKRHHTNLEELLQSVTVEGNHDNVSELSEKTR